MMLCVNFIKRIFWVLHFFFFVQCLNAQNGSERIVGGIVVNADTDEPLINVHVKISGTLIGTVTDEKGAFTLNTGTEQNVDIELSHTGYKKNLSEKQ